MAPSDCPDEVVKDGFRPDLRFYGLDGPASNEVSRGSSASAATLPSSGIGDKAGGRGGGSSLNLIGVSLMVCGFGGGLMLSLE